MPIPSSSCSGPSCRSPLNDERKRAAGVHDRIRATPTNYGQLTAYVIDGPLPPGPLTVAADISQFFATDLSLLDARGSEVQFGDLQVVPTGAGLLYVRPWFVQAEGANTVPALDSVSVTYGNRAARGDTIGEALGELFPGTNIDVGDRVGTSDDPTDPGSEPTGEPSTQPGTVEELIAEADRLLAEADEAKGAFDSKTYEEKTALAIEALRQAAELALGRPITAEPTTTDAPVAACRLRATGDRQHLIRPVGPPTSAPCRVATAPRPGRSPRASRSRSAPVRWRRGSDSS